MNSGAPARTRPYRMTARAEAAVATGERILDAALARFSTKLFDEVTLSTIARDAGVTTQTVIRRFGSKEGVFEAVAEREGPRILAAREPSDGASIEQAVHSLVMHYEHDGHAMVNFLRQEDRIPVVHEVVELGRQAHEAWVTRHCASVIAETTGATRARRLAAAIAATDIFVWKLLRVDRGLDPEQVEAVMLDLLEGLKTIGDH